MVIGLVIPFLFKARRKKHHLIPRKVTVTRAGRTYQTTVWVNPEQEGKQVYQHGLFEVAEKKLEPEVSLRGLWPDLDISWGKVEKTCRVKLNRDVAELEKYADRLTDLKEKRSVKELIEKIKNIDWKAMKEGSDEEIGRKYDIDGVLREYSYVNSNFKEIQTTFARLNTLYDYYYCTANDDIKIEALGLEDALPVKDGVFVSLSTEGHSVSISVFVPYSKIEKFLKKWCQHTPYRKSLMKIITDSAGYKQYLMTGGNRKIKQVVEEIAEISGLETTAVSRTDGSLKPEKFLEALTDVKKAFGDFSKVFSLKDYRPPDDKHLKIAILENKITKGAFDVVGGQYSRKDVIMEINPSYLSSIAHEIGHYLWDRHLNLTDDFSGWAKSHGYSKKVDYVMEHGLRLEEQEYAQFYNETFDKGINKIQDYLNVEHTVEEMKEAGMSETEMSYLKTAANVFLNIMREELVDVMPGLDVFGSMAGRGKVGEGEYDKAKNKAVKMKEMITEIKDMSEPDLLKKAMEIKLKNYKSLHSFSDLTEIELVNMFHAVQKAAKVDERVFTEMKEEIGFVIHDADKFSFTMSEKNPGYAKYARDKHYWGNTNEMFARAFNEFVRYKAAKAGIFQPGEYNVYSWKEPKSVLEPRSGSWAISPEFTDFEDGAFEEMIEKHTGEEFLKALTRMVIRLEKRRA